MFDYKGRVKKTEDGGCMFYDQDIIFLDYIFRNDCTIDMDIEYVSPGFGIFLAEADTPDPFKSGYSVLYRLGDNIYSSEERYLEKQQHVTSGTFYTKSDINKIHITFYKTNNKIWMTRTYTEDGKTQVYGNALTTSAGLSETLDRYRIGFYSNKNNVIYKISIASGMPKDWIVNIKNTNGGRVSFHEDGFSIEECEYNADIEQQNIELNAGTYWLSYTKSDDSDISVYVNKSITDKTQESHLTNTDTILDKTKSILKDDGSFTLSEKGKINIKFSGTHGTIDNIAIKDLKDSSYISTDETGESHRDGSCIIFDLDKITSFDMEATVFAVPNYKLTEKPTYSIFNGDTEEKRTVQDAGIALNEKYSYKYKAYEYLVGTYKCKIDNKSKKLYVLNNVSAEITKLVVTLSSGKTIDIINDDTYKIYISDKIESPIIVTDLSEEPYDLSSSYREVIISSNTIDLFNKYQATNLSNRVNYMHQTLEVYGIKDGVSIHTNKQDSIDEFADSYERISTTQYTYDKNTNYIKISSDVWNTYKYVAVSYQSADYYKYVFTNWEREFFDTSNKTILEVEKDIMPDTGRVVIYGIDKSENLWTDYLYRIDNENMIHSIDLFALHYNMIDPDGYTINYDKRRIFLSDSILNKYKYFVVDYLKNNSYAINHLSDEKEYEVDVSSANSECKCLYDMNASGSIHKYILTKIMPDKDRYITISKKE